MVSVMDVARRSRVETSHFTDRGNMKSCCRQYSTKKYGPAAESYFSWKKDSTA